MKDFKKEKRRKYTDVPVVESQRNDLTSEEFPEGPYGMNLPTETLGKSTPWREDQEYMSPFGYENKVLHEGLPREYPQEDNVIHEPDEDSPS